MGLGAAMAVPRYRTKSVLSRLQVFTQRQLGDDFLTRRADARWVGEDHERLQVIGDAKSGRDGAGNKREPADVGPGGILRQPGHGIDGYFELKDRAARRRSIHILSVADDDERLGGRRKADVGRWGAAVVCAVRVEDGLQVTHQG